MHRWIASAAGGTSQRLNLGPAMVRSRDSQPEDVAVFVAIIISPNARLMTGLPADIAVSFRIHLLRRLRGTARECLAKYLGPEYDRRVLRIDDIADPHVSEARIHEVLAMRRAMQPAGNRLLGSRDAGGKVLPDRPPRIARAGVRHITGGLPPRVRHSISLPKTKIARPQFSAEISSMIDGGSNRCWM